MEVQWFATQITELTSLAPARAARVDTLWRSESKGIDTSQPVILDGEVSLRARVDTSHPVILDGEVRARVDAENEQD